MQIPVWEHLVTDQTDQRQVVPRQVFTPYDCLLISVAFVFLFRVGCVWVTDVIPRYVQDHYHILVYCKDL